MFSKQLVLCLVGLDMSEYSCICVQLGCIRFLNEFMPCSCDFHVFHYLFAIFVSCLIHAVRSVRVLLAVVCLCALYVLCTCLCDDNAMLDNICSYIGC